MRRRVVFLAVGVGASLLVPLVPAAARAAENHPLPRRMRVSEALHHLGARADGVARSHGQSESDWRMLAADQTAWLDQDANLYFVEPTAPASTATGTSVAAAPIDLSQTFLLHSSPSSTRKLFLDFDGHTIGASGWSSGTLTAAAYSADADGTAFSDAEKTTIQDVWARVAEDYAPFDIDVTTEDPGYAGINRASTSDTSFGTRVVITGSTSVYTTVCPSGCGGVAYVGTIDATGTTHDYYQPAWVFTNGVGYGAKNIAEAAAHEAGHNMGLSHDGTATTGYYSGQGAWAPIMGVGYYKPVSQWSRGEYTGANQLQDDFVVVTQNAVPLRTDDIGGPSAPAPAGPSPIAVSGIIHNRTDQDAFSFTTTGGQIDFTATPGAVGANLDIRLALLDESGTELAAADPAVAMVNASTATGLDASLSLSVPAGTYRVVVDGVGFGSAATTGYSDYASVGRYTLTGTYPTDGTPVNLSPLAVATASVTSGTAPLAVTFDASGSTDPDGTIAAYQWTFSDGTTSSAVAPVVTISSAGTFTATLVVVDDAGAASPPATVTVNVAAPAPIIRVQSISMSVVRVSNRYEARAVVTITDQAGNPVRNASVTGAFTGLGAVTRSTTTSSTGTVTISSARVSTNHGTFSFAVTRVVKSGTVYDAAQNLQTTATVTY